MTDNVDFEELRDCLDRISNYADEIDRNMYLLDLFESLVFVPHYNDLEKIKKDLTLFEVYLKLFRPDFHSLVTDVNKALELVYKQRELKV